MHRPLVFLLAAALAASGAMAQAPVAGPAVGAPIKVQPVEIGRPPAGSGAADPQRAQQVEPSTQPAAAAAAPPRIAPPPVPLGNCNAGGCWDSQGKRYNSTGDGSRFIGPDGRMCQASGNFIHCN